MSWDSYIDNLVAQTSVSGTAHADRACIIGLDGAPWTTAGHAMALKLQGREGFNIATCFKNKDFSSMESAGVFAEGVKYQFLREEDKKMVFAKRKDHGALTMQASKTAVVIGHTAEGCQQGNTNKGVALIAEYLESMNM